MGTYTKRCCIGCGRTIESWHKNNEFWRTHIGVAVDKCPYCGRYNRNIQNEEYIMLERPKMFIASYLAFDMFKSILFGGIIGSILFFCIDGGAVKTLMLYCLCCVLLLFILHCLALKKMIEDSIKRTSLYEYRKVLRSMYLISEEQFRNPMK